MKKQKKQKSKRAKEQKSKRAKEEEELTSVAVLAAKETGLAELGSRNSNGGGSSISNDCCISNDRYRGEGRNRKNGM